MHARGAVAVVLAIAASAAADFTPSPFVPGLRIVERRTVYRPGSVVRASVLWEHPPGEGASGRFDLRWQLRGQDGMLLDHGRRPLRIPSSAVAPYRFPVRARIPRDGKPFTTATLEVAVERSFHEFESARTQVWIRPGQLLPMRPLVPYPLRGTLERDDSGRPMLRPEHELFDRAVHLAGPVVAVVLRHPDWVGAEVELTGTFFLDWAVTQSTGDGLACRADDLEFLDPPPERLEWTPGVAWDHPVPEVEWTGDYDAYRAAVGATQTPRVAESVDDLAALREEFGSRIDLLPPVDFETSRIVVVTAGRSPDGSFIVALGEAWFEPRSSRTTVLYDVIRVEGYATAAITRPWLAVILPRRPGPIVFKRREWVGDLPGWWPPTLPY